LIRTALVNNTIWNQAVARHQTARANLGIDHERINSLRSRPGRPARLPSQLRQRSDRLATEPARDARFGSVVLKLLSFEVDIWGRQRRATEAARADLLGPKDRKGCDDDGRGRCLRRLLQSASNWIRS